MRESACRGSRKAAKGAVWTLLALSLSACAADQAERHDELVAALRASGGSAPPKAISVAPSTESDQQSVPNDALSVPRTEPESGHMRRLDRARFVESVLRQNPSVEASRQAFRGALSKHVQARAFADPMLQYTFAPLSIGSSEVPYGQSVTLSQNFPWPGKRALAGEAALAEAEAAKGDFEAVRLRLALMASLLFDQYYAVDRSLALNAQHKELVESIKRAAQAQYEAGGASQQEPLQAEVELAQVERQTLMLASRRAVITAQMNGLLHRAPETPLPDPPEELDLPDLPLGSPSELQAEALANRPELRAQSAALRGREAARDLAERESYPDLGVMTQYNSMWKMWQHQWMVGLSLNVPLQLGRRRGAVDEAQARIAQLNAALIGASDEVRVEVETARQELIEARAVVGLYRERLLPAARAQIEAARSGYVTSRNDFQALIDAERSLRNLELDYQQALATLGERRASVLRSLGRIPGFMQERRTP